MRKQYHFWPGDGGLDAWDVDRLIEIGASLEVEQVSMSVIRELDTVYWFDETQPPTVRNVLEHVRLIDEVDLSYPIILGPDGRVMDGMHRVARALLDGRQTLPAIRFPELPEPDFQNCRPDELPYQPSKIARHPVARQGGGQPARPQVGLPRPTGCSTPV